MSEEQKTKTVADMIAESTTVAMATRTAAIETMIREFIAQTGAKVEDLVLVEQMGVGKLTWHIEEREPQPAPENPSAPREATTENFDRLEGCGLQMFGGVYGSPLKPITTDVEFVRRVQAREATEADIRANIERETKGLRGALESSARALDHAARQMRKFEDERDQLRAELLEAKGEFGAMIAFVTGGPCGTASRADAATIVREEIRRLRGEVERLTKDRDQWRDGENTNSAFCVRLIAELKAERDAAKAANREQRRKGAEDAANYLVCKRGAPVRYRDDVLKWLGCEKHRGLGVLGLCKQLLGDVKEFGIGRGLVVPWQWVEALRVAVASEGEPPEKQERAPEKTGRLPTVRVVVWTRNDKRDSMELRPVSEFFHDSFRVEGLNQVFTKDDECVLWCWPRQGMAG